MYLPSRRRGNPKPRPASGLSSGLYADGGSVTSTGNSSVSATASVNGVNGDLGSSIGQNGGGSTANESTLIGLYYEFFHAAHPCVLPRAHLGLFLSRDAFCPLLRVICYIGSFFSVAVSSEERMQDVQDSLASIRSRARPITGFDAQALLLYSIAVYWSNEPEYGTELLDEAIEMAVELGMNHGDFATRHGEDNPVLEESWRRTWWLFYITDAHIAGSTHSFPFRTTHIEKTVHLPCEEHEYESGVIPPAKTLDDYDNREFFPSDELRFSSYAELIGLTRGIERALSPGNTADVQLYMSMCAKADTSAMAWYSLLPSSKRRLICVDDSLDEIMFKAQFILHTYTVEMHRPMSTLSYNPVESVARCAPLAPSDRLQCLDKAEAELHTAKCLSAIEKIDHLLTLPTNLHTHTPFLICMVANATIAHLSACRFLLQGEKLAASRDKIRLTMGILNRLGEHWGLGKRTFQELGVIAREVLCLPAGSGSTSASASASVSASASDSASVPVSSTEPLFDVNMDFGALFGIQSPGLLGLGSV